jgi:acetyl esterase/lipase
VKVLVVDGAVRVVIVANVVTVSDGAPPRATVSRRTFLGGLAAGAATLTSASCGRPTPETGISLDRLQVAYGADPAQIGDLTVPLTGESRPVLVLIHGGYWKPGLDRTTMAPLGESLGHLGYAVWNIDYRTVGTDGGGWPGTFADVGLAIDHLATLPADKHLDLAHVITVGHSAGGHLALWAAARGRLDEPPLDARPLVRIKGALSFAGVPDLVMAATAPGGGLGGDLRHAVLDLLDGAPDAVPDRYAQASPRALLPLGVPQLLVHGSRDDRVPVEQAQVYSEAAAAAGDAVRLVEVPTGDHGDITRADRVAWPDVVAWLSDVSGRGR